MPITFKCVCGKGFNVPDDRAGQSGTCPQCKMPVTVPGEAPKVTTAQSTRSRFPKDRLMAYLRMHQSTNILVLYPHIPPERENTARERFSIEANDGILAAFHPSLLLAGEEGMVFTESGIYLKKADLTLGYVLYESLLEGSIHLEDGHDIVLQAVKPQRLRYRILVSPTIAEYLSKILRGLQLLLNGRDPAPIFGAEAGANALQELRAERQGLLPSSSAMGDGKARGGLLGALKKRG